MHRAMLFHQANLIQGAYLVKQYQARLGAEREGDAKWRRMTACGHGRDNHGTKKIVDFGRRDHDTGPGFLDFAA